MKLVVGLGNPGKKYSKTRHNVGFQIIDQVAKSFNQSFKLDVNLKSEISIFNYQNEKVILLKPQTYMNLSGDALSKVINYYKIEIEDVLIIYDEIYLPTGKLRMRELGSDGGHNGMKHIINHLKTENLKRIKIGVDVDKTMPLDNYVLGNFSKNDQKIIDEITPLVVKAVKDFVIGTPYKDIMTSINTPST